MRERIGSTARMQDGAGAMRAHRQLARTRRRAKACERATAKLARAKGHRKSTTQQDHSWRSEAHRTGPIPRTDRPTREHIGQPSKSSRRPRKGTKQALHAGGKGTPGADTPSAHRPEPTLRTEGRCAITPASFARTRSGFASVRRKQTTPGGGRQTRTDKDRQTTRQNTGHTADLLRGSPETHAAPMVPPAERGRGKGFQL